MGFPDKQYLFQDFTGDSSLGQPFSPVTKYCLTGKPMIHTLVDTTLETTFFFFRTKTSGKSRQPFEKNPNFYTARDNDIPGSRDSESPYFSRARVCARKIVENFLVYTARDLEILGPREFSWPHADIFVPILAQ